jgi:hypothetical protein
MLLELENVWLRQGRTLSSPLVESVCQRGIYRLLPVETAPEKRPLQQTDRSTGHLLPACLLPAAGCRWSSVVCRRRRACVACLPCHVTAQASQRSRPSGPASLATAAPPSSFSHSTAVCCAVCCVVLCSLVLQPARATRASTSSCIVGDPSPTVMQRSMAVDRDEETTQPGTGYRDKVGRAYLAGAASSMEVDGADGTSGAAAWMAPPPAECSDLETLAAFVKASGGMLPAVSTLAEDERTPDIKLVARACKCDRNCGLALYCTPDSPTWVLWKQVVCADDAASSAAADFALPSPPPPRHPRGHGWQPRRCSPRVSGDPPDPPHRRLPQAPAGTHPRGQEHRSGTRWAASPS